MSTPKLRDVLAKSLLELVGMILLLLPLAYIYLFTSNYEPFHRGFFCNDQDLKHPYKENQTVPIVVALALWLLLAISLILLVETLRSTALQGQRRETPIPNRRYPPWLAVELYRYYGFFTLGACGCLVFTELSKYTIGRLRPHFISICKPDFSDDGMCKDESDYHRFVTEDQDEICLGLQDGTTTPKMLHEARLSFLSGHSSFSFYCATYLIVYLQARLTNFPTSSPGQSRSIRIIYWTLKVFRPFLQFGMLSLAFWVSLTRISDYFHHPYDVVTGALVGIVFAVTTMLVMADIFNKRSAFWKSLAITDPAPETTVQGGEESHGLRDTSIPYIDECDGDSKVAKARVF